MGIKIDLVKKGINYVLKSAKNTTPNVKLSIFEGVEGPSAKKLASVFETKSPLKQGATNPFETGIKQVVNIEKAKNVSKALDNVASDYPVLGNEVEKYKKLLLSKAEYLETLPEQFASDIGFLRIWSKNPEAWKAEYSKIPFDKMNKTEFINRRNYAISILENPAQAIYKYDSKMCRYTFGQIDNPSSLTLFDLSELKNADGSFDKLKLAKFFENIKNADEKTLDEGLLSLKEFINKFNSPQEMLEKYPKTIKKLSNEIIDGESELSKNFGDIKIEKLVETEKLLDRGFVIGKLDCPTRITYHADRYATVLSNPEFANLEPKQLSEIFWNYDLYKCSFSDKALENYSVKLQTKILKNFDKLTKFKHIEAIVRLKDYEDLFEKVLENPKLLSDLDKNEKLLHKIIPASSYKYSEASSIIRELARMKTFYPSEYYSLAKTKGFQDILAGYTDINILWRMKYSSRDRFFSSIYADIEEKFKKSTVFNRLTPTDQGKCLNIAINDPVYSYHISELILNAKNHIKDNKIFHKVINRADKEVKLVAKDFERAKATGHYFSPEDLNESRCDIRDFLQFASECSPETMKYAMSFKGSLSDIVFLAQKVDKLPVNIKTSLLNNAKDFKIRYIKNIIGYIERGGDEKLLNNIFERVIAKEMKPSTMSCILHYTTENNISYVKNILKNKDANLSDLTYIAYATEDLKPFSVSAQRKKILDYFKDIKNISNGDIDGNNSFPAKILLKLRVNNPEKYAELEKTGIFDYIKAKNTGLKVLYNINENSHLSKELISDLKLWKEGKSIVQSFPAETSLNDIMKQSQVGDVVEVGKQLFINDGTQMYRWDMTKEKYLELFPPVQRFMTRQGDLGDCYLIATLNSMMQNPQSRVNLYKSFKLDGNDIKCTIAKYKDFKGTITFKDGVIKLDDEGAYLEGCKGLQMLEQSYAKTALRKAIEDPLNFALSSNPNELMSRIHGGNCHKAGSELLGLVNGNLNKISDFKGYSVILKDENMFENALNKFGNNDEYILNFGTVSKGNVAAEQELLGDYDLVTEHAYSLLSYDKESKIAKIVNPHNTSLEYNIPFNKLKEYINHICITSLK